MGAATGFFRGENGLVLEMDLPLPDAFAARLQRGEIAQVNEDGSPYEGPWLLVDTQQRDDSVSMIQDKLAEGQLAQVRDDLARVTAERDELRALVDQATTPKKTTKSTTTTK